MRLQRSFLVTVSLLALLPAALLGASAARAGSSAIASAYVYYDPPEAPLEQVSDNDSNENSATASAGAGPVAADASAFANEGVLRAEAFFARVGGDVSTGDASARAFWEDTLTIGSSGREGQIAQMTVEYEIEGVVDPLGNTLGLFSHEVRVQGAALLGSPVDRIRVVYKGSEEAGGAFPGELVGLDGDEYVFQPGDPFFVSTLHQFTFAFELPATLELRGTLEAIAQPELGPGLNGSTEVNFFNTSQWKGITSLQVDDGGGFVELPFAEASITSASGVDYRFEVPVPEPAAPLQAAAAVAVMAALRRRQPARLRPTA
jgi:hypothetical protein